MADTVAQAVILLCGLSTVFLSTAVSFRVRRLACLFGMFSQPFWLYTSFTSEQWGVLILSVLFWFRWTQVFIRDWFKHPEGPATA